MWITIAVLGYAALAVVSILDKFILAERPVSPRVFVFYSSIFALPILALIPFGVIWPKTGLDAGLAMISGLAFSFALWSMYLALKEGEVSHIGPFIGAVTPLVILALSPLFLPEILTGRQFWAMGLLIVGTLLISVEKSDRHNGLHIGFVWAFLAAALFAVSHLAAKYLYDAYGFYSGFVWTRGAIGLFGLLMLFLPSLRRDLLAAPLAEKKSRGLLLVSADKILGVVGVVLVQYAIALGSVAIVNALAGAQYALLVILVALFTRFAPKIFREVYTRDEIIMESAAVLIITAGLFLLIL